MFVLKTQKIFLLGALFFLGGCHFSYLVKNGYHQAKILKRQIPIDEVLKSQELPPHTRHKLELAKEVLRFSKEHLGLDPKGNYENYVQLQDKYVSYAVIAAPAFEVKSHIWNFPIVGGVPYKGFFVLEDAEREARDLAEQGMDTHLRGVTAFSTLGWLNDPLLSSMIDYYDEDFVDLIIHETVHSHLYIPNAADFNERLATFLGDIGSQMFFKNRLDGWKTLEKIEAASHDQMIFSEFVTNEIKDLNEFYTTQILNSKLNNDEKLMLKESKILEIQKRFQNNLQPKLKTKRHSSFGSEKLNNARLASYGTYVGDLSKFKEVYSRFPGFREFFEFCKTLENSKSPESDFGR